MKTEYLTSEAERAYRKKYYAKNRERCLANSREYHARNREADNARSREYALTHDRSEYFRRRYQEKKAREKNE